MTNDTHDSDAGPAELSTACIVDNYRLCFDGGDMSNASLYVCTPGPGTDVHPVVGSLVAAGLWSAETPRQVRDDQRAAYRDGLEFVDAAVFADGASHFVLGRFDHPKFPSDDARWRAWLDVVAADYERRR